jgi:hypothetical protein
MLPPKRLKAMMNEDRDGEDVEAVGLTLSFAGWGVWTARLRS